ncbi:hypothetical protein [Nocardioides sp. REDSEA-S30_B4]|jgi:thiol-disulfide isomerase/thioredoxin|uniref:hypothetical protein n=1 Tax=Nocardioides sp. REDSEA-S30_B4 TaxID=1811552 RepID=UPI0025DA40C5|nr:hypothetical protein [Nocardioides sp. REDSEA-S30_B4]
MGTCADSDVVLYVAASWCHHCQDTDASLDADGVPAGLTLVKIDYDERTDRVSGGCRGPW